MTRNDIVAELSYAYLHAVAARAGFGCTQASRHEDNAGVDARIQVRERLDPTAVYTNFSFEIQLKATSSQPTEEEGRLSYWLKEVKRYDVLRDRSAPMPKLLAVMYLPESDAEWLSHSEEQLVARRCAYWTSLWDAPATTNGTGKTVYLPRVNVLSVSQLREIARRLACQEELSYAG